MDVEGVIDQLLKLGDPKKVIFKQNKFGIVSSNSLGVNMKDLTLDLVSSWTPEFNNWEICDTFSMGVYAKSTLAENIILEYSRKQSEYEKRAAFATLAAFCIADKKAPNSAF